MQAKIPYTPREPFISFHQRSTRFAAMCFHRRAGKTVASVADIVIRAIFTQKPNAQYAYIGPFRAQAKKTAWRYLKDMTEDVRKSPPRESDLEVRLINGATITIFGADRPDSLRGLYFDGMVVDEYGDCRPSLWGEVLLPTLLDRRGWAVFIGTMKGKNHFWRTLERAKGEDTWFYRIMKASESGLLTEDDLNEARAEMTEAQYRQEMECDPEAAVPGTYYSHIISELEQAQAIGDYPYDSSEMVHVAADLGFSDSTAFWFWQVTPDGPVMIDYHEADGEPLQYYIDMLAAKGYEYADIWLPHDAVAKTLQTGRSTVEQLLDEGLPCKVVPRLAVQHGIDAARKVMVNTKFDLKKCFQGIESLRAYRRQFNEKTQQYSNTPLHDWASNGADAFRYFALVTSEEAIPKPETKKSEPLLKAEGYCLEDLFKQRENWRSKVIRM